MNEKLLNSENSDEKLNPNKYMTRKKIIDFAKIGEKLSLTGSNCHYCKSVMTVQDSNACRSRYNLIVDTDKLIFKKKSCNKKFCYDCLKENFPKFWESRAKKDWKCPCCLNECNCSQCKKNWIKEKSNMKTNKTEQLFSQDVDLNNSLELNEDNDNSNNPNGIAIHCEFIEEAKDNDCNNDNNDSNDKNNICNNNIKEDKSIQYEKKEAMKNTKYAHPLSRYYFCLNIDKITPPPKPKVNHN